MERWDAHGNVYLVTEEPLDADRVRAEVGDADGIVQVHARGADWADVVIWNPDGSTAEMSGNGTRIAARWLAERWGVEVVRIRVADREVVGRGAAEPPGHWSGVNRDAEVSFADSHAAARAADDPGGM